MSRRLLAGLLAACVVGAGGVLLSGAPGAAAPAGCVFLRVHTVGLLGLSVLTKVRLADGGLERVGVLGYRIDALGHAPGSPLSYGLATRGLTGPFADGAHVVTVDVRGSVRDLGPIRGRDLPKDRLAGATAGAMHRGRLVVRDGLHLYEIDVDPRSPDYLAVARKTELRPYELARTVDDFESHGSMLYGVSTHAAGYYGRVVKIDPTTGRVHFVLGPKLPGGKPYGAALIGPDGALYAATNLGAARSRLFRVDLHGPGAAVRLIAAWPAVDSADATGCVAGAPPPTTPPTTTPPTTTPPPKRTVVPPPPVTGASRTSTPIPPPVPTSAPRPPSTPVPPPPPEAAAAEPPPPPPANRPRFRPPPAPQAVTDAGSDATEKKRRWGVAVLVMILAAGAAAGRVRHR